MENILINENTAIRKIAIIFVVRRVLTFDVMLRPPIDVSKIVERFN
jgi:hypothetical protein